MLVSVCGDGKGAVTDRRVGIHDQFGIGDGKGAVTDRRVVTSLGSETERVQ